MQRTKFNFSNEEDLVIIRNVENYPDNLNVAFEKTMQELNSESFLQARNNTLRSIRGVANRYYSKIRTSENKILCVGSKNGFINNTKNTPKSRDTSEFPEDRQLNKVEWVVKILLSLNNDERDFIINFFNNSSKFKTISKKKSIN